MKWTLYAALEAVEGFGASTATEEETLSAWQWLIDRGHAFRLQGRFGRTAVSLINSGRCRAPQPRGAPAGVDAPAGT